MPFLHQDVEMMESEQRTYRANPMRRYVEINPAIIALQRLIVRQYEQFVQQSSQSQSHCYGEAQKSMTSPHTVIASQVEQISESSVG
jgi:hypothetical protein